MRKTQRITANVQPVLACDYPVRLVPSGTINAYANGNSIVVLSGLLDAFPDDKQVGVVSGHELAYNLMGHIDKKRLEIWSYTYLARILNEATNSNIGSVYAEFNYLNSSVDSEYEADYVGLYLAARAGLEYEQAPMFLRKLALNSPGSINRESTHPKLATRYVAQEAPIVEINRKRAQGRPLIPEMKGENAQKKTMRQESTPGSFQAPGVSK